MMTFSHFRDVGNQDLERAIFKVLEDGDVGRQLLLCTRSKVVDGKSRVVAVIHTSFWLPDRKVKKDDLLVVYSKPGSAKSKENKSGRTSHFFYWGSKEPLWNRQNVALVFGMFSDWDTAFPMRSDSDEDDVEPASAD